MWTKSRGVAPSRRNTSSTRRASSAGLSARRAGLEPDRRNRLRRCKMSVFKRSGTETDLYTADGSNAWAMQLSCTPPNSPAAASLKVEPVPCPGGGASCPLADGATVFPRRHSQISPSVSPRTVSRRSTAAARLQLPRRLDRGRGRCVSRIVLADESGTGNPAASYTLVAPATRSGRRSGERSGCWNSVQNNTSFGGAPDFTTPTPAAGARRFFRSPSRRHALGSANKAVQNLTWKVPTVRLKNPAILLGGVLQDGSDAILRGGYSGISGQAIPQVPASH